jgi:hypothetical protein
LKISLVGLVLLCCLTIQTGGRREKRERVRREEERRCLPSSSFYLAIWQKFRHLATRVEYFSGRIGAALFPYHPGRGQEGEKGEVEEGGGEKEPSLSIIFILLFGRNFGTWQQ